MPRRAPRGCRPAGCPAKRQLELSRLVERDEAEAPDAHRHFQVESSPARCRRDDDECSPGAPNFGAQGAVIETLEPCAPPPPARHREQAGDRPDGPPGARGEADRSGASKRDERRKADEVRERDPERRARRAASVAASGAGPGSWRRPGPELVEPRRADPWDGVQPVHRGERPVLLAVVEDLLRRHRADPGQRVELLQRCGAQVDRPA